MESFDHVESLIQDSDMLGVLQRKMIKGDRIRAWISSTPEGQAVCEEIKQQQVIAITEFLYCDINDIEALKAAKMKVEIAQNTYSIFNAIIQDADTAESIYKQSDAYGESHE